MIGKITVLQNLPLDLSAELHIKGPDAVAVEYRRMMADLWA